MEPLKNLVLGIDPGSSGGLAWISLDGKKYFTQKLKDLTEKDIFLAIQNYSSSTHKAFIEKVNVMPMDGKKSIWTFSGSYHSLRMALFACNISFSEVSPVIWQGYHKCKTKGNKNISKKKAQELFPEITITHANADALLIAEFGRNSIN